MAEHLAALRKSLRDPEGIRANAWDVLQRLTEAVNNDSGFPMGSSSVQELVLRALEHREAFGRYAPIVDTLARKQGLYPYLESTELPLSELLALEAHRPLSFDEVVFHRAQLKVYELLMAGENVVLSAPTSFGKSLIIDALIASRKFDNTVVVVPTIALIDETRRRLSSRFGRDLKIVTQVGQPPAERNVFIFTQERVLQYEALPKLDLFVIDEFYKLDPRKDPERAYLLNQAFYYLHQTGAQFYMLGPSIRQLPLELPHKLQFHFLSTDYATVVSETTRIHASEADRLDRLVKLATSLTDQTLIYCASPASARRVATALIGASIDRNVPEMQDAASWIGDHFHPDWVLARALRHGIGLHHGKIPRSLAQHIVSSFNAETLKYLVCTSTLIEGVNTKAKNVIVYDNRVAKQKLDFFTFNNIRGRSGRMFQHFIGQVFLFSDAPPEDLPEIDIPAFTQTPDTPESVLVQLAEADLTEDSRRKLRPILDQKLLSLDVIRLNRGIDPAHQIELAGELTRLPQEHHSSLYWSGLPSHNQLRDVCELIWKYFVRSGRRVAGVSSGSQLAFKIGRYRSNPDVRAQIVRELAQQGEEDIDADRAVEEVLEFVRVWVTFSFPRYLMTVDTIQKYVFRRLGAEPGDYRYFAALMENQFLPAGVVALEEYGLPVQVSSKLRRALADPESIDEAISRLRTLSANDIGALSAFEHKLLNETIAGLGPTS